MWVELNLTIPGHLVGPSDEERAKIEDLLRRFGNARKRAYNMIHRLVLGKGGSQTGVQRTDPAVKV